jgi:nucleotide-binding universal stress UspA family protein
MKILVAYDGSAEAKLAVERAAEIAKLEKAEVAVVSVVPVMADARGAGIDPTSDFPDHRRQVDEAVARLKELGTTARAIEAVGNPADAIIQVAETEGTNLVIIGSRGHSGVQRFLMGSVSARVAQHAPCNVYIAR